MHACIDDAFLMIFATVWSKEDISSLVHNIHPSIHYKTVLKLKPLTNEE